MSEVVRSRRGVAFATALGLLAVVSVCVTALAQPARGASHHPRTRKLDVSWVGSVVLVGNPRTIAGATTGTLGQGSVLYRAKFVSGGRTTTAFYFQIKLYYDRGLVRATATGIGTVAADGSELFSGTVKVLGGTGSFRGARGGGKISGNATAFSDLTHLRLTHQRIVGSISY